MARLEASKDKRKKSTKTNTAPAKKDGGISADDLGF